MFVAYSLVMAQSWKPQYQKIVEDWQYFNRKFFDWMSWYWWYRIRGFNCGYNISFRKDWLLYLSITIFLQSDFLKRIPLTRFANLLTWIEVKVRTTINFSQNGISRWQAGPHIQYTRFKKDFKAPICAIYFNIYMELNV